MRTYTYRNGFTIVELLIVIVVIGILAAITIVSFNGVTARANTTGSQASASSVVKKAEAYNAEKSGYPATFASLTASADSANSYYIAASSMALATANLTTAPTGTLATKTVVFNICGNSGSTTAPANLAAITGSAGTITGIRVNYWNFSDSNSPFLSTGTVTGSTGTFPIACFPAQT